MAYKCPKDFKPRKRSQNQETASVKQRGVPFIFLFIGVSKEDDFFVVGEEQSERPLDTIHTLVSTAIGLVLIILQANCLLEVDGGRRFLGDIVESNKISTDDSKLPATPSLNPRMRCEE